VRIADEAADPHASRLHATRRRDSIDGAMADLRSKPLIVLKGVMFVLVAALASACVFALAPDWRVAALLAVVIWSSARAYYFLFYVLERYVDPRLRYAGLTDMLRQLWRARRR
jgi:hypothetical protein